MSTSLLLNFCNDLIHTYCITQDMRKIISQYKKFFTVTNLVCEINRVKIILNSITTNRRKPYNLQPLSAQSSSSELDSKEKAPFFILFR